mmetsp:Transcript_85001/g.226776  ORF Transcript_85001/g.226776 Transcript_85001/m.226776 type:complete len:149 (+) Transcript_85001:245-691(+)
MSLCMTDLNGIGSRLFVSPPSVIPSELIKRSNPDSTLAPPPKRPAPAPVQVPPNALVTKSPLGQPSSSSSSLVSQIISDPKRVADKHRQKQGLLQVKEMLNFLFFLIDNDLCQVVSTRRQGLYTVVDAPHFDNVQLIPCLPSKSGPSK